ncbi:MAG TPA: hypothetical protein DEQ09_06740 [Bacteroidales bacterium]|nr:hypothetical protein [Bacteroidales bacterium]
MKIKMDTRGIEHPGTMVKTTRIKNSVYHRRIPVTDSSRDNLYRTLSNDGCEDFYNYIDWLNLAKKPDIIILPRKGSFYYMPEDLKDTETLINLKPLNLIKDLRSFLKSIYSFLPEYSYFTGCFEDHDDRVRKSREGENNSIISTGNVKENTNNSSWMFNMIHHLFSQGFNIPITRRSSKSLLENTGFTILDITGLNGKTYFCVQKRPVLLT